MSRALFRKRKYIFSCQISKDSYILSLYKGKYYYHNDNCISVILNSLSDWVNIDDIYNQFDDLTIDYNNLYLILKYFADNRFIKVRRKGDFLREYEERFN